MCTGVCACGAVRGGVGMLHKPSQQAVAQHENKMGRWRGERKKDAEGTDEEKQREDNEMGGRGVGERREKDAGLLVGRWRVPPRGTSRGTAFSSRHQKRDFIMITVAYGQSSAHAFFEMVGK